MKCWLFLIFAIFTACNTSKKSSSSSETSYNLSLTATRVAQVGLDPFTIRVTLLKNSQPLSGQILTRTIPRGSTGVVTDNGDGTYDFTVTPTATGLHPVTVSFASSSISREIIVTNELETGAGQPMAVPGLVNTDGYEDGITITPDGQYLFIQYGPVYFSGIFLHTTICAEAGWSLYDLTTCPGKDDSNWVFETIGPYNTTARPSFPDANIGGGQLTPLNIVVPSVANKIAIFPTVFYGFKRQSDGTFREPFKVAFNDSKGANGPFGLSFVMTSSTTAQFAVAWNNYFNDLGDDKPDIYQGTLTLGQDKNLGDVVYSGDTFQSITPTIAPVNFTAHTGTQGNPHLYANGAGTIESIWTDDEQSSHDLTVYRLTAGSYPTGTWTPVTLPSTINTDQNESQPFFTGSRLYLTRNTSIVYHEYLGSGGGDYHLNGSWGAEVVVLRSTDTALGGVYGFGEPTIATYDGKTYLYFAYVETRAAGVGAGRFDYNLGAGFVELP